MSKVGMVAVLLMLPFLGCLDESSDTEEYTGYCQEELIIEYDDWEGCHFELDFKQEVKVSWTVNLPDAESSEEIDVYFIDENNIDEYRADEYWLSDCEEFVYEEEISREYVDNYTFGIHEVELLAGDWWAVIDNKNCTGSQPYDDVRVDYYIELTYDRYKEESFSIR